MISQTIFVDTTVYGFIPWSHFILTNCFDETAKCGNALSVYKTQEWTGCLVVPPQMPHVSVPMYTLGCCHAIGTVFSIFIHALNLLLCSSNFSTESSYPCIGKFNCLDPDVDSALNGELEWRSWRVPSDTTGSGIRTEQELCHSQ